MEGLIPMETTTGSPTGSHAPASGDVDASIAAARRVQHLSAVVKTRLTDVDVDTLDRDALAKAVVKALYDEHPYIRLDDALELARIVETPPADTSTTRAIEHVVGDVCTHLDEWNRFETPSSPGHQ